MKNIIKTASTALVAMLVMTSVAFAAPSTGTGSSPSTGNGGSTAGNSIPSTGNGGSTAGNTIPSTGNGGSTAGDGSGSNPDNGTDNGSGSNGGSKSRRSGGGGSSYTRVNISDVKVSVVGNVATVTWTSNPLSLGRIVYGTVSVSVPNSSENYGYANGSKFANLQDVHSVSFMVEAGKTYFVRPVSAIGTRTFFGSELKVSANSSVATTKTAKPAIGIESGSTIKIDTVIPSDVEISISTSTSNTAAAGSSKIGSFFKKIWNTITAPFCR